MEALRAFLGDSDDAPTAKFDDNKSGDFDTGQKGKNTTEDARDEKMSSSIDDLIRERTAKGWARPPSARRRMVVVLQIETLPDGTLTSVTVVKSSGDVPFDNSAVKAVKNISPLTEMNDMKADDSQPYRSFKMTLSPNDFPL
jgi:colicin import membrane protein